MLDTATPPKKAKVKVSSIIYNEGAYYVLRVNDGFGGLFTAVGTVPPIPVEVGSTFLLTGNWIRHKEYGLQLEIVLLEPLDPHVLTLEELVEFLSGPTFPGVGPTKARALVNHFGSDLPSIIENQDVPTARTALCATPNIGPILAESVVSNWTGAETKMRSISALKNWGISYRVGEELYKKYGESAIAVVESNPYSLIYEVSGIGFRKADIIGKNLGIAKDDPRRVEACFNFCIKQATTDGSTCVDNPKIMEAVRIATEATADVIYESYSASLRAGRVIVDAPDNALSLPEVYDAEQRTISMISSLMALHPNLQTSDSQMDTMVHRTLMASTHSSYAEDDAQILAVTRILSNTTNRGLHIITGGPGAGKTSALKGLSICNAALTSPKSLTFLAPTGRAAQRIRELSNTRAWTIHAFCLSEHPDTILSNGAIIVIDEASMVDITMLALLEAKLRRAGVTSFKLVLMGDPDQLPPVGAGDIFRDLVDMYAKSTAINYIRFPLSFRHGRDDGHGVFDLARAIRNDESFHISEMEGHGIYVYPRTDPTHLIKTLVTIHKRAQETHAQDTDYQILCPMYKGPGGIDEINTAIQKTNDRSDADTIYFSEGYDHRLFKVGDKVIQVRNDYTNNIFNGEIGQVQRVVQTGVSPYMIVVYPSVLDDSDEYKMVIYDKQNHIDIKLAYAISFHRAQGGESDTIIMVLLRRHYFMLSTAGKELVYTGLTRARKRFILVGDPKQFYAAVKRPRPPGPRRMTRLPSLLPIAISRGGIMPSNSYYDAWVQGKAAAAPAPERRASSTPKGKASIEQLNLNGFEL